MGLNPLNKFQNTLLQNVVMFCMQNLAQFEAGALQIEYERLNPEERDLILVSKLNIGQTLKVRS